MEIDRQFDPNDERPGQGDPELSPPSGPFSDEQAQPFPQRQPDPPAESATVDVPPAFLKATATAVEPETDETQGWALPHEPRTLAELGLSRRFLADLTLKIIHYSGTPSASQLVRRLGLGQTVVQQLLTALAEERLVEVLSQSDLYTGNYRYRLSEKGSARAAEALERGRYAGAVPVTAEQYNEVMRKQLANRQAPSRSRIKEALRELVITDEVADAVSRALYSGKASIFYGPSGNGKTSILTNFARHIDGAVLVPHAIYAYGQVIRVFDQSVHEPLEQTDGRGAPKGEAKMDRRWVLVRRPAVMLGAEAGPDSLELAYDPQSRFYQASPHIKAQGGLLIVDDFGRQRIEARTLLTRWLIPLERGSDTLSLATGEKLTVPFGAQLLLATNLSIRELADDALLRRILYKVEIPDPPPEQFSEMLHRLCLQHSVAVNDGALEHAIQLLYGHPNVRPRASYARDLLEMLLESAAFDERDPVLSRETFDKVFRMFADERDREQPSV